MGRKNMVGKNSRTCTFGENQKNSTTFFNF